MANSNAFMTPHTKLKNSTRASKPESIEEIFDHLSKVRYQEFLEGRNPTIDECLQDLGAVPDNIESIENELRRVLSEQRKRYETPLPTNEYLFYEP